MYDFNQQKVFSFLIDQKFGLKSIGNLIYLKNNNYISYYYSYTYISIIKFTISLDQLNEINLDIKNKIEIGNNIYIDMISCIKTEKSRIIICFYGYREEYNKYYYYNITAYTQDLIDLCKEQKKITYYSYYYTSADSFIKCIAFKEDVGAFFHYKDNDPVIFFREYINKTFKIYFDEIFLDQFSFDTRRNTNDFIKISKDKLGFFSSSPDSETIYIIIINFI